MSDNSWLLYVWLQLIAQCLYYSRFMSVSKLATQMEVPRDGCNHPLPEVDSGEEEEEDISYQVVMGVDNTWQVVR